MKILGIDPGSRKSGFGLIADLGGKPQYLDSKTIKFDTKASFIERVPFIYEETKKTLLEYKPDVIAIESLIYVKSPTALIKLAQTRGIILAAIVECKMDRNIFEYSPNLIKSQTLGHGHADKLAGQKFLFQYFGISEFDTDDESDALLVALCHCFSKNIGNKSSARRKKSGSLASALAHKI